MLSTFAAGSISLSPLDVLATSAKKLQRRGDPKKVIVIGAGLAGRPGATFYPTHNG